MFAPEQHDLYGTDSGCGGNDWPKTFVFLAGRGYGHATLNGRPPYQGYEVHFRASAIGER